MKQTLFALAACLIATSAQAQLARTFVSANGSDANPCSRVAPCRSLAVAHTNTIAAGEINMLDPAGYGTVTITKSISIVNDGVGSAGVLVPSGQTGITVDAGPTDVVNLRGLIVEGTNVGNQGVRFNSGGSLTIENCVVRNLAGIGIAFYPNASARLAVSNTFVADVGNRGIHVSPVSGASGTFTAVVSKSEVHNGTDIGIFAQGTGSSGTLSLTVSDSVSSGNANDGIRANSLLGAATTLTVVRSVSAGNGVGISAANPDATVRVARSTVTGNASGWIAQGGAVLQSYGDNHVDGNASNQGPMPLVSTK